VSSTVGLGDLDTRIVDHVQESLLACAMYYLNWIKLELNWAKVEFKSVWVSVIVFGLNQFDMIQFGFDSV